jgi:hypothetical protein
MMKMCGMWCIQMMFKYQRYDRETKFRQRNNYMHRERPELWPNDWILHHGIAPCHKALSVKQILAHKFITEIELPPSSLDVTLKNFWPFPKTESILKERR